MVQQRVRVDLADESAVVSQPQVGPNGVVASAQPVAQVLQPRTRSNPLGCVPSLIIILFGLVIVIVYTIALMGLMGSRISVANDIAKAIGYTVVTFLTPNSMARLGYAVMVIPVVLIAATWITARAWK